MTFYVVQIPPDVIAFGALIVMIIALTVLFFLV